MSEQIKFVQGNEACVEAALYAGLDFFAGYPLTPSSEILELLTLLVHEHEKTVLMVTHDPRAAECAQVTLHLDKGVLIERDQTDVGAP